MTKPVNDPLNLGIDLNQVDTGRPVLVAGTYQMNVASVEVQDNKAGTGRNLIVDFATTAPATSTKDKEVAAGFRVRNYYPLQPSDKKPENDLWQQRLAQLQDAVLGTTQGDRPPFNPHEFKDKMVMIVLDIESSEEYGDQNRVKRILRLEEE